MKYLGKSYLHKFLIEKGYNPPALKYMVYGKDRGDEWLKCDIIDIFCIRGKIIFLSEFAYDEQQDKYIEVSLYCYDSVDGENWIKNYECKTNG